MRNGRPAGVAAGKVMRSSVGYSRGGRGLSSGWSMACKTNDFHPDWPSHLEIAGLRQEFRFPGF